MHSHFLAGDFAGILSPPPSPHLQAWVDYARNFSYDAIPLSGLHLENFLRVSNLKHLKLCVWGEGGDNPSWRSCIFLNFRPPENASGGYFKS